MILTLEEAKEWLRIDSDDEDSTVQIIIDASEQYLKQATGNEFNADNSLAKLYCLTLITDWYENRELVGQQVSDKVRYTIQSMLAQLSHGFEEDET